MFIKKITTLILLSSQLLALIGVFVLLNPINATIAVSSNQENIHSDDPSEQEQQEIVVTGSASYGTNPVTGRVRIITNRKQLRNVCSGDIVVASAINSFWYSGLSVASAIITEKNDNNALALGKKLNMPVIVGANGATKKMVDNEIIICDPLTNNVYHVAYLTPQDVHFDVLAMSHKDNDLYQKVGKEDKIHRLPTSEKAVESGAMDCFPFPNERKMSTLQSGLRYKPKRITKDVYRALLPEFKKFLLKEKSWFEWTKRWFGMEAVEAGARTVEGYDELAVACICVGQPFIESPEQYINNKAQKMGESEEKIEYLDSLLDDCSKKPKDLNHAALIAHRKLVEYVVGNAKSAISIPKEYLMEHPREYKKFQNRISKDEHDDLVLAGYFARFWIKTKKPL